MRFQHMFHVSNVEVSASESFILLKKASNFEENQSYDNFKKTF